MLAQFLDQPPSHPSELVFVGHGDRVHPVEQPRAERDQGAAGPDSEQSKHTTPPPLASSVALCARQARTRWVASAVGIGVGATAVAAQTCCTRASRADIAL